MNIFVAGTAITKFGELWDKSLQELIEEVALNGIKSAGIENSYIEAIFVANKAAGSFENQRHLNAICSQLFEHFPPSMRLEGACASGGLAMIAAEYALLSGMYKTVMVIGVEKMTDANSDETTTILSSAADSVAEYGSTFPGLYGMLAQAHMQEFQTTREQLSHVAVKNHRHAFQNKNAQFHKEFSIEQISNSQLIADPLRLLDCSPISDGAAAVVLTTNHTNKPRIMSFGQGQASLDLAHRRTLTTLDATVTAAKQAYTRAGIESQDIQVAEVHDCFTIAEILAIEDLGFFSKGEGGKATQDGKTTYKGNVLVNPSGGLKACGHPVGATGVKQIAFMAEFLENNNYTYGLTHNVGGSGATAVVHILGK